MAGHHKKAGTHPGHGWYFHTNTELTNTEILDRVPDSSNWKTVKKAFMVDGRELTSYCSIWKRNKGEQLTKGNNLKELYR